MGKAIPVTCETASEVLAKLRKKTHITPYLAEEEIELLEAACDAYEEEIEDAEEG